mmetsp:Transcript_4835/g.10644  ORF Transcript_4835/g.10644 Transcript_4835/m.10644 type:complete len:284 (-) Transcript_4835:108-959(-)
MASTSEILRPNNTARKNNVSDDEWEIMKSMISEQLDNVTSNLDELRENGSLEAIAQTIKRGDKCPAARLQAWYHGMLEVEYCNRPFSVSQKLQHIYKTHAANGPDETPQSFILDTNISLAAQSAGSEQSTRRSERLLESAESVVGRLEGKTNLTVVERQELWLAKKNVKVAKAHMENAQKRMNERAQSAPDLSRSRRSFIALAKENKMVAKGTIAEVRKRSGTADATKRPITAARKRARSTTAIDPGANPRSLGNITNQTETTKRRKRQKMAPLSDPFILKKS